MVVAAAEVAVGLAIIAMIYRNTKSVDVSIFNKLKDKVSMESLIYAIVLLPLIGFLTNGLLGKFLPKKVVGGFATAVVFVAFCIAVNLFCQFKIDSNPIIVKAFEWFRVNGMSVDFGFQIDQLSLMMVMIITGIGSLIHFIFSGIYES